MLEIKENKNRKIVKSEDYNYMFDKNTGHFVRYGKTLYDDPEYSKYGPEILDIEITDICRGPNNKPCSFCYKSNNPNNSNNMSFEMFKDILDRMPRTLTQIAFGADAQCESNPDIWKMMEYCREKEIIPNITVADITDKTADKLAYYCGAVAVSRYDDEDICYNSIKKLVDRGMDQINIHIMLSENTFKTVYKTMNDYLNDERLKKLNAIVLLSLKQKGRGKNFNRCSNKYFKKIVNYSLKKRIPLGFDSCSCNKFLNSVKNHKNYENFKMLSEPCESACFSSYINTKGYFYPCSFVEDEDEWKDGIYVPDCDDFLNDVWFNKRTNSFRDKLLKNNRNCPKFNV